MRQPLLSIIIPAFNCWALTRGCLHSLRENTTGQDLYEVIVVDNASSDETAGELPLLGAALFGENFRQIRHETNRNFSGACNAGAEAASAPLLFFLNNDTLLSEGWLPPLLKAFSPAMGAEPGQTSTCPPAAPSVGTSGKTITGASGKVGAVGPLLLYPETGRVQHLGIAFSPKFEVIHLYQNFIPAKRFLNQERRFQALTGAALMLPAALFGRLGGFHSGYINGSEDIDLCLRLAEAGYTMHCRSDSVIQHLECQSKGRTKFERENTELLMRRCKHLIKPDLHEFFNRDNYSLQLTPEFNCYPKPRPEFTNLLRRKYRDDPGPENLRNLLRVEPAWEEGYMLLGKACENAMAWDEMCTIYSLLSALIPKKEHFEALGRASGHSGQPGLQAYAGERCRMLLEHSRRDTLAKALEALEYAEKQQDGILLDAVRTWLRRQRS